MDREEATMNEVKINLMESQNPPAMEWMANNLPTYFTEDVAMIACQFCPMKAHPEYVIKQLKEHFGPRFQRLMRPNASIYRVNGAPKLERRDDASNGGVSILNFNTKSSDVNARKIVYTLSKGPRDTQPTDQAIKAGMLTWYTEIRNQFYGSVSVLPNQKPSAGPELI
jgi:hypothetical protein